MQQGYDFVKINGVRKIVVSEEGKKLRKAFLWRADGMKNAEIIQRLNAMGVASSPVGTKEELQKLIFPEGIIYSKKNEAFRTEKVNSFFLF